MHSLKTNVGQKKITSYGRKTNGAQLRLVLHIAVPIKWGIHMHFLNY